MKRLLALAVSLALAVGLCPSMALASNDSNDGLAAGRIAGQAKALSTQADDGLDLTRPVDGTYSFTADAGKLYWTMPKAGIAYVNVKVEGVDSIGYSLWHARDDGRGTSNLDVYAGSQQVSSDGFDLQVRCDGKNEGEIDFRKIEADEGSGAKVTLHITSTFKPANASARNLGSGDSVDVIQAAGDLYWTVKLKKACEVTLSPKTGTSVSDYNGVSLCNSKKKTIESNLYSDAGETYVVPKGTYYVRTRVTKSMRADEIAFFLTAKSIGNYAESTNTTRAKAKKVVLGKKATGFIGTSNPEFKAHYYKLNLKKAKAISAMWENGKGVQTGLSILNQRGKALYESSGWANKGAIKLYRHKDAAWKNPLKKVSLARGTYYLKVTGLTSDYGAYTLTVK